MLKTTLSALLLFLAEMAYSQPNKQGYGAGKQPIFALSEDSTAFANTERRFSALKLSRSPEDRAELDSISAVFYHLILSAKGFIYKPRFEVLDSLKTREQREAVTEISIAGLHSKKLPTEILQCKNLERLEIVNSSVKIIQSELSGLKNLKEIDVYDNAASRHLRFGKNNSVTKVIIKGENARSVPKKYGRLRNLEYLDLTYTRIRKFPVIHRNLKLKYLFAGFNELTLRDLKNKKQVSLQVLDLRSNKIKKVPATIRNFPELISLALNNNEIAKIGRGFTLLKKLEYLSLYNNQLAFIPRSFYSLTALTNIDLYYNHISEILPDMAAWKNLAELHLAYNLIATLPKEIGTLSALHGIYINNNHLSSLPDELANLTQLADLRIGNNYFSEFPGAVLRLTNLKWLDLNSNQFKKLPEEILQFKNLEILSLYGNPWDAETESRLPDWVATLRAQKTSVLIVAPVADN